MQQNNYIEAEDAYRRALSIAPDNNKMCNLGICLMKQGRIVEAKETLRLVKPAMADGPRGTDSHLKAYERAQQMLKDLESEMMNKGGGDRLEQRRLFDAFLGSSSIWQPQPCKDHTSMPTFNNSTEPRDGFADENVNSNIIADQLRTVKQAAHTAANCLNIAAAPFFSSRFMKEQPIMKDRVQNQFPESHKRTRSGNPADSIRMNRMGEITKLLAESEKSENKSRRLSVSPEETDKLIESLPDNKAFEDAILGIDEAGKPADSGKYQRKIEKRLKAFEDITLSMSTRA
jgi:tetratricopeptide (TPR) repeat protein